MKRFSAPILLVAATCLILPGYGRHTQASATRGPAGDAFVFMSRCRTECARGFYCEYEECVGEDWPFAGPQFDPRVCDAVPGNRPAPDPRRVLHRVPDARAAGASSGGAAPVDVAVIGSGDLVVTLDAFARIEVIDERTDPPHSAAWTTAQGLSHLEVSPTGQHVVAYYDWDQVDARDRQPAPGNRSRISVLSLAGACRPFADTDPRVVDLTVGLLPRAVRFAADGSRAVIVGANTLTPVRLASAPDGVAAAASPVAFDGDASEVLIDGAARSAILRYPSSARIDVLNLTSRRTTCFLAPQPVSDVALTPGGSLLAVFGEPAVHQVAAVELEAADSPCRAIAPVVAIGAATSLAVDPRAGWAVGYVPDLAVEAVWIVELGTLSVRRVRLEKAVSGVAFAGDGVYALLANMKAPGLAVWDPKAEDTAASVDKAYGFTWLDMVAGTARLLVSGLPFRVSPADPCRNLPGSCRPGSP